ncbi:MAG: hypothetical protein Q8O43_01645, partial [Dehalococcoidia bacterium]|nr:hypothetical protein [Dehalococcoidia bacterium]
RILSHLAALGQIAYQLLEKRGCPGSQAMTSQVDVSHIGALTGWFSELHDVSLGTEDKHDH